MTSIQSVGIDVSKDTLDVCFKHGDRAYHFSHQQNTPTGWAKISALCTKYGVSPTTPVLCEATGCYHLGITHHLHSTGYCMKVVNPFVLSTFAKLTIRKTKTDKQDSVHIAELGSAKQDLRPYTASSESVRVKKLVAVENTYARIIQQLTTARSSLQDTHAQGVVDLSLQITQVTEHIHQMEQSLKQIRREMMTSPEIQRITTTLGSIRGVSPHMLASLVAELGDLSRFQSRGAITAYC